MKRAARRTSSWQTLGLQPRLANGGKYEHKFWKQSYNIPETMFEGVKDPLHLTETVKLENGDTVPVVTMKPVLDWCSLAFLMRQLVPGEEVADLQRRFGKGACGKMGPGRK